MTNFSRLTDRLIKELDSIYIHDTHVFCTCGSECYQINANEYVCPICNKIVTID